MQLINAWELAVHPEHAPAWVDELKALSYLYCYCYCGPENFHRLARIKLILMQNSDGNTKEISTQNFINNNDIYTILHSTWTHCNSYNSSGEVISPRGGVTPSSVAFLSSLPTLIWHLILKEWLLILIIVHEIASSTKRNEEIISWIHFYRSRNPLKNIFHQKIGIIITIISKNNIIDIMHCCYGYIYMIFISDS